VYARVVPETRGGVLGIRKTIREGDRGGRGVGGEERDGTERGEGKNNGFLYKCTVKTQECLFIYVVRNREPAGAQSARARAIKHDGRGKKNRNALGATKTSRLLVAVQTRTRRSRDRRRIRSLWSHAGRLLLIGKQYRR